MMRSMLASCILLLAAVTNGSSAAAAFSVTSRHCRQASAHRRSIQQDASNRGKFEPLTTTRNQGSNLVKYTLGLRAGAKDESENINNSNLGREMLAELLGTFLLVSLGTGSVMSAVYDNALVGLFQIAAVWVFAVTVAISTTASVSGAHLNPAISFALALLRPNKAFGWTKVIPYCLAQLAGGVLAAGMNLVLFGSKIAEFEKANSIVRGAAASVASAKCFGEYFAAPITWPIALLAEAFGTAVLSFVVFSLTNPRNDTVKDSSLIPPLVGITVGALICVIAPLTQAGFNPARDFAPRIVAGMAGWGKIAFQGWWVYVVGPLLGAPIGAYVADKCLLRDEE